MNVYRAFNVQIYEEGGGAYSAQSCNATIIIEVELGYIISILFLL
jgi:hypothetical protein